MQEANLRRGGNIHSFGPVKPLQDACACEVCRARERGLFFSLVRLAGESPENLEDKVKLSRFGGEAYKRGLEVSLCNRSQMTDSGRDIIWRSQLTDNSILACLRKVSHQSIRWNWSDGDPGAIFRMMLAGRTSLCT